MKKIYLTSMILLIIISLSSCQQNKKQLYIEQESVTLHYWEVECIPDNNVELIKHSETFWSMINLLSVGYEEYWRFEATKPGEFTLCWLYYDVGNWMMPDNSYAVDYYVDENLEIHPKGVKKIYEIEKYDKYLFEQYTDQIKRNFVGRSYETDGFGGIWYSITGDYSTKTINLTINNNNYDESQLVEFTKDRMDFLLNSYSSVSAQYNYTVVVE